MRFLNGSFCHPGEGRDPCPPLAQVARWIPAFAGMTIILFFALLPLPASAKPVVVASFSILGDMVRQVGGDAVELHVLVGPDADAHVYEPTPADARLLAKADLVIVNGLGFEGWLSRLVEASGYRGPVVVATKGLVPLGALNEEERREHGDDDPHAWQSLANAPVYIGAIRDALVKADPVQAALYMANAQQAMQSLAALDGWVRAQIATVPPEKRNVITSHDAFQYFAQAYGVHFIAPQGVNTESQPSARDVARLIDQIRSGHIRALFMENITDPRLIAQLRDDGGAVIGGTLYSDALSAADGPAATYQALFRHNVTLLVAAMQGN